MGARALAKAVASALARQLGGVGAGVPAWTPALWFQSGEQGAWYDPSDFTRYMADKGPELILDPEFDNAGNWTTTPSWTVSGGVATHNGSAADYIYTATEAPVVGKWYELTVTATAVIGVVSVYCGQTPAALNITAPGTHKIAVQCPGTGLKFSLRCSNASGGNTVVTAFSAKELTAINTATMFQDSAGTTPVAAVEQPVGKILDKSGRGNHASQTTAASRPVLSARKNKLLATTTLATQSVTLTAAPHTLSFKGTGTVTLSGASTAGPLVGTGAGDRVSLTFTPAAGSVTFTVSGSVTEAQLENGSAVTTYQRVTTATDYDTAGFPLYLKFDGVDDSLETGNVDFSATDKMTVVAGVTVNLSGARIIYEHGSSSDAGSGFGLKTGAISAGDATFNAYATSLTFRRTDTAAMPIGAPRVVTHKIDIAGAAAADEQQSRFNGADPTYSSSVGTAAGSFTSLPLYIGRRGGASMPSAMNLFGLIVRGVSTTDPSAAEAWMNGKTGAY